MSCVVGIFLLIALAIAIACTTRYREKFKVLGTLAPHRQVYYRCLSECERSDPGRD